MRAWPRAWIGLALLLLPFPAAAHGVYRLENGKLPTSNMPFSSDLKYFGGHVISNVNIVEVAWNSSVDSAYMTQLQGFYKAIVVSPFIDWMTEYDTIGLSGFADLLPGTNQHIGRGSFGGNFVITPSTSSTTITDTDIQNELVAQLTKAALPAPTVDVGGGVNSLYMFDFPAGASITLVNISSCSSFGAYHFTVKYNGMDVPYGVHPNCGYSFNTSTLIHSHELAEAITDTEVGAVEYNTTNLCMRPLAWTTIASTAWASQEAGDLCEGTSAQIATYTVQKIWSNYAQGCVAEIPICDGVLIPPACRPCNTYDSGNACTNACALGGTKSGQCVTCTGAYPNACTGPTPVCDDATYTCVGCLKNADCTQAAMPICDATSHTCRACTSDGDCGGGDAGAADAGASLVCDLATDMQTGQCVACNTDAQCGAKAHCTAHACVPIMVVEAGPEVGDSELVVGTNPGCGCTVVGDASRSRSRSTLALLLVGMAVLVRRLRRYWA
jgi:MYXO-CTERM domain-containing protein